MARQTKESGGDKPKRLVAIYINVRKLPPGTAERQRYTASHGYVIRYEHRGFYSFHPTVNNHIFRSWTAAVKKISELER